MSPLFGELRENKASPLQTDFSDDENHSLSGLSPWSPWRVFVALILRRNQCVALRYVRLLQRATTAQGTFESNDGDGAKINIIEKGWLKGVEPRYCRVCMFEPTPIGLLAGLLI